MQDEGNGGGYVAGDRASEICEWVSSICAGSVSMSGIDLVLGADDDVDQGQNGAGDDAEGARVVPLVGPEVDVEDHVGPHLARRLGGEHGGAAAWLLAQVGAGELQDFAVSHGGGQHVVDGQLDVGAVVAVVDQRELVRRLDAQHDRAGAVARLARAEARVHAFLVQEVQDEIADRVLAQAGEQRGASGPIAARPR